MTDLKTVRRMQRANVQPLWSGKGRTNNRWDKDARLSLESLCLRTDGTPALLSKLLKRNAQTIRRECRRLGIHIKQRGTPRKSVHDIPSRLHSMLHTRLAILCDERAYDVKKLLNGLANTKVKDDKVLIPHLQEYWQAIKGYTWPEMKRTPYKLYEANDLALVQWHRLYTLDTLSFMLGSTADSVALRARELDSFPRTEQKWSDMELLFMAHLWHQLEPATVCEVLGITVEELSSLQEWEQSRIAFTGYSLLGVCKHEGFPPTA